MRAIMFLAGLAMAASWFLTWLEPPFAGPEVSPMRLASDGLITIGTDSSWQTLTFAGGFVAAGLTALLALMGRGAGLFALIAGVTPLVVGVDGFLRADELRQDLGLPFPLDFSNIGQTWDLAQDFIRLGFWAYLGGAGLLLVAGMSRVLGPRG